MNLFNQIVSLLRSCPVCGKSFQSVHWLCSDCEFKLVVRLKLRSQFLSQNINHKYIFNWHSEDHFLEKVVYSIKGGGLIGVGEFLKPFLNSLDLEVPDVICYPSKGKRDHAYDLALTMAGCLKCSVEPLVINAPGKQSLKRVSQRRSVNFEKIKGLRSSRILLVDDIVTSGSTVEAAHRALGGPRSMQVFSLFFRPMRRSSL